MKEQSNSREVISGQLDRWSYWSEEWVRAKSNRTGSKKTEEEYRRILDSFRQELHNHNLDVDSDVRMIATFAERWAATPQRRFIAQAQLRPTSIKHTLDILSSFYRYLMRHEVLERNPLDLVERPHPGEYEGATPLDFRFVRDQIGRASCRERV